MDARRLWLTGYPGPVSWEVWPHRLRLAGLLLSAVGCVLRDTGRMSLKQALAANRWVARLLAVVTVSALNLAWVILTHQPRSVGLPPSLTLDALGVWCVVMSVRTGMAQAGARCAAAGAEAKELRTLRAPDAGPDQCPVCGGFGLDALAEDDVFMDRGPLAKVVAYGGKRAHWDCAEVVPYKPAAGGPISRGEWMVLPKGFELETRINPERVFTGPDGKEYVSYAPERTPSLDSATRPATVEEYADWLRGFLRNGGQPTHYYDYPFDRWDGRIRFAHRDFHTSGECGSAARHIIVPTNVRWLGGGRGHNTIHYADGFRLDGTMVPVFTDPVFDVAWALGGAEARRQYAQQRWGHRR